MEDVDDVDAKELTASTVVYACYSLFVYYLQQDDVDTKCSALRALSGVFMARPRVMLMNEQDGTIEEIMSSDSSTALQLESLRCWKEILLVSTRHNDFQSLIGLSVKQTNVFPIIDPTGGRQESCER